MSVIFSKSCEYAIQAVLYLGSKANGTPTLLREVSDALDIPHHFLSKVMQQLTKAGILESHKGTSGGFIIAKPSSEITIMDIVSAVDGQEFLGACVLGFPGCGDNNPCPVHDQWKKAREAIQGMVSKKTVADLGMEIDGKLDFIEQLKKKS